MLTSNPFAEISAFIPPFVMQGYILVMIILVIGGTVYDTLHKKSAKYFFQNWRRSNDRASQQVSTGQFASLAIRTIVIDALLSGEFCNLRRRVAHLLGMYGFVVFVATTTIMIFGYPTPETPTPAVVSQLWHLGALMVCVGGYWFWFFIRVDVAAEGNSPFRLVRADLFVVSLVLSTTFALIWAYGQASGITLSYIALALYLISTAILFGSVPWSKFSHMFFKPAAAYQKNLAHLNGGRNHLPAPSDKPAILGKPERHGHNY